MRNDLFVWACTPSELPFQAQHGGACAHLGYRISDRGRLFYGYARRPSGGVLVLSDDGSGRPDREAFLPDLEKELRRGRFVGLFADFETVTPALFALVGSLDEVCAQRALALYVPEPYAVCAGHAFALIGSDVAAGDFALRLEEQALRFGARLALELVPLRADFRLPGEGKARRLTLTQLDALRKDAQVYFSSALCANYFTYRDADKVTHFVLFDDEKSLARKCELADKAGVRHIFALAQEISMYDPAQIYKE